MLIKFKIMYSLSAVSLMTMPPSTRLAYHAAALCISRLIPSSSSKDKVTDYDFANRDNRLI